MLLGVLPITAGDCSHNCWVALAPLKVLCYMVICIVHLSGGYSERDRISLLTLIDYLCTLLSVL